MIYYFFPGDYKLFFYLNQNKNKNKHASIIPQLKIFKIRLTLKKYRKISESGFRPRFTGSVHQQSSDQKHIKP